MDTATTAKRSPLGRGITPAQREAIKDPQVTYASHHFAVRKLRARVWTVTGLEGGAWPHFWKQTTSEGAAMFIMLREMEKQVEHLNDFINHQREQARP